MCRYVFNNCLRSQNSNVYNGRYKDRKQYTNVAITGSFNKQYQSKSMTFPPLYTIMRALQWFIDQQKWFSWHDICYRTAIPNLGSTTQTEIPPTTQRPTDRVVKKYKVFGLKYRMNNKPISVISNVCLARNCLYFNVNRLIILVSFIYF